MFYHFDVSLPPSAGLLRILLSGKTGRWNGLSDCVDGWYRKVRENSKVINKTVYIAVGLRRDGYKEVPGMWLGKNESAAYWMSVLTDMKARGLEDIIITATDNLNGFTQTIRFVFPASAPRYVLFIRSIIAADMLSGKIKKNLPPISKTSMPRLPSSPHWPDWMDAWIVNEMENMPMLLRVGGRTGKS